MTSISIVTAVAFVAVFFAAAVAVHKRRRSPARPCPHMTYTAATVNTYLVTVELSANAPPGTLSQLNDYAKKFPGWGEITDHTWLVLARGNASQVRDAFKSLAPAGTRIFVLRSGREAAWTEVKAADAWLHRWL